MNQRSDQRCVLYLVPGTELAPGEHEQVAHGDQTGPCQEREETQHPLENRFNADEDEDGQEEEQSSGNRYQERQVILRVLQRRSRNKTMMLHRFTEPAYVVGVAQFGSLL